MPPLQADVAAVLKERSSQLVADKLVADMGEAGARAGREFSTQLARNTEAMDRLTDQMGSRLDEGFRRQGTRAGQSFGGSFTSQLAQSLPGVSGFASAMSGYEGVAAKSGAAAGRAMGLAFTTAAAGLIGAAGYTLFKGFERYQAIDAATNRLENLNRTMQATGRQAIDVGAVMDVVNKSVMDTPFALDQAFSVATRALASNTGDLERFMGVVTDAAGFTGEGVAEIGEAFLKVANRGKVSMEELSNELRGIPLSWLSDELGVTGAALSKMISDGNVGLESLMQAVETNAGGYAKSAGDTIAGAMANAQTAVARLGANFLGALFGKPTEDGNDLVEVLKTVRERLDDVNAWVTAHQDDIQRIFADGVRVAGDLASAVMGIIDALDSMGIGVDDVVKAFVAWQAIKGVTALSGALTGVSTMLTDTLPASAATGAAGISTALAKVAIPAWLTYLVMSNGPEIEQSIADAIPGGNTFNNLPTPADAGKAARDWVDQNIFGEGRPNPVRDWGQQQTAPAGTRESGGVPGVSMPGGLGGPAGSSRERRGDQPFRLDGSAPPAGGAIIAGGADGTTGDGPRPPPPPGVPYAEVPDIDPRLQMTAGLYSAATSVADARTRLAEKEARLAQLEATTEATAEERINARADRDKAEREAFESELRFTEAQQNAYEQQNKQLDKMTTSLGEFGAKIADDFGASEGLAGIAENITKFIANLAFAPAFGALSAVREANGFGQGEAGSGLMGALGSTGMFGPSGVAVPRWARDQQSAAASAMGPGMLQPGMATGGPASQYVAAGSGGAYAGVPIGSNMDVTDQPGLDLLRSMGLKGATYGGHTTDGASTDREVDVTDPAGGYGSAAMTQFADFARQNPHLFEEFIYSDPTTGQKTGIRSGQLVGPGTSQPGYYAKNWAGHQDHAHMEPAKGGGLGFMGTPGSPGGANNIAPGAPGAGAGSAGAGGVDPGWFAGAGSGGATGVAGAAQAASGAGTPIGPGGPNLAGVPMLPGGPLADGMPNSPILGTPGGGLGSGVGRAAPSQSVSGGRAHAQGLPESGGIGLSGGGLLGLPAAAAKSGAAAAGMAGMGMDGGAGGAMASALADMGIQQLQRAAGAAGQYVGALAGGAIETFALNGSALGDPSASWFGRIAAAVPGVRASLPNSAGMLGGAENPNMAEAGKEQPPAAAEGGPPGPMSPEDAAKMQAAQGGGGDNSTTVNNNVSVNNPQTRDVDGSMRDVQTALGSQQAARQPR